MDRIYRQQDHPLSENMYVAVAIAEPSANQRHTGMFFRFNATDPHEFLHLEWHCRLSRELLNSGFLWVDPAIPSRRLKQVAAICDAIASANTPDQIPYSFSPPNDCFDEQDCTFLLGPTRTGLTCASFVLAVFHRAGVQLIKYGTWPKPTQEDIEWQRNILSILQRQQLQPQSAVTQAHIKCVQSEVGNFARYRPEHVAAAAIKCRSSPVRHQCALRLGVMIVAYIRKEPIGRSINWWGRLRIVLSCWMGHRFP